MTQQYVKVQTKKTFTESDFEVSKEYNLNVYGELYDTKFLQTMFPSMKFVGFTLVDIPSITRAGSGGSGNTQEARASGGNSQYKSISANITTNGWDLYNPMVPIRKTSNGLYELDARTRITILQAFGVKNVPIALYTCNDEDASAFAIWSNTHGYKPRGFAKLIDVMEELKRAIENEWIVLTGDQQKDYLTIKSRVDTISSDLFTETKRAELAQIVLNQSSPVIACAAYANSSQVKAWMLENKYINTNQIIYLPVSANFIAKAIINASMVAYENPDKEVRVVVHTGILTGGNLEESYKSRVVRFKEGWELALMKIGTSFFNNSIPSIKKINLYGALPAVSTLHPLDKLVRFGHNDSYLYDVSSSISLFEEDDEEETV
jgi:hypothetical protein